MKKNIVFLIGAVLAVALVSVISIINAATSENQGVGAAMTVNGFVDTTLNASSIGFCVGVGCDPNTTANPANTTVNLSSTDNSNVQIDIYLNNTNMTDGGNIILFNLTKVNTVNTNSSARRLNGTAYINGTGALTTPADSGFVENLPVNGSVQLWFWQDVPLGQVAGSYTETLNIRAVQSGIAP